MKSQPPRHRAEARSAPPVDAPLARDPDLTEQELRLLVDASPVGVWLSEPVRGVVYANRRLQEQLGVDANEVLGYALYELIHPDDQARFAQQIYDLWVDHRPLDDEVRMMRADGEERIMHARAGVVVDVDGVPVGVVGTAEDVTLQRRHDDVRRQLVERLVEMSDRERAKLSEDLHDGPAQDLTAARILLERLESRAETDELRRDVAAARALVERTADQLRIKMNELSPPGLRTEGLAEAIAASVAESAAGAGMDVEVVSELVSEPTRDVRDLAYLLVQEALGHARRHSHAGSVEVLLREVGTELEITVVDDGQGIAPEVLQSQVFDHVGLSNMRDRAVAAGGGCEVRARPGTGTEIEFRVPLDFVAEPRAPRR